VLMQTTIADTLDFFRIIIPTRLMYKHTGTGMTRLWIRCVLDVMYEGFRPGTAHRTTLIVELLRVQRDNEIALDQYSHSFASELPLVKNINLAVADKSNSYSVDLHILHGCMSFSAIKILIVIMVIAHNK
jgi:hypothetical protein